MKGKVQLKCSNHRAAQSVILYKQMGHNEIHFNHFCLH